MEVNYLKHFTNYWNFYEYVSQHKEPTVEEFKEYLVKEKNCSSTTLRRNMQMLSNDESRGFLLIKNNKIGIDREKLRATFNDFFAALNVTLDSDSDGAIKKLEKRIHYLEEEKKELVKERTYYKEELEKKNEEIKDWRDKNVELEREIVEKMLDQEIQFAGDVKLNEPPNKDEEMFAQDFYLDLNIEDSLSLQKKRRKSFYAKAEDLLKEVPENIEEMKGKLVELNEKNAYKRTFNIFSKRFWGSWKVESEEIQALENKIAESEKNLGIISECLDKVDEKTRKRKKIIERIMNDQRLTDKTKLQFYARYCDYHLADMESLINFVADYGVDARFFIQLVEDGDEYTTAQSLRDFLTVFAKDCEYRKKLDFARELVDGKWYILLDYKGKQTPFTLVPITEIEEIRERLALPKDQFAMRIEERELLRKKKEEEEQRRKQAEVEKNQPYQLAYVETE